METDITFSNILNRLDIFISKFLGVNWLFVMYVIFSLITILLIVVIFYSLVRLYEFKKEDDEKEKKNKKERKVAEIPKDVPAVIDSSQVSPEVNVIKDDGTWKSIRNRLLSDVESDWRMAIIEADIYLDKVLDRKGWHGDTLGDKLKSLTPLELPSLQIAWEAHKVRNQIAHDASYILTMPEARRVLSYFEIVFRDLEVIE